MFFGIFLDQKINSEQQNQKQINQRNIQAKP